MTAITVTIAEVKFATASRIDWNNNRGLHSCLGYLPPAEFQNPRYPTANRGPQPT